LITRIRESKRIAIPVQLYFGYFFVGITKLLNEILGAAFLGFSCLRGKKSRSASNFVPYFRARLSLPEALRGGIERSKMRIFVISSAADCPEVAFLKSLRWQIGHEHSYSDAAAFDLRPSISPILEMAVKSPSLIGGAVCKLDNASKTSELANSAPLSIRLHAARIEGELKRLQKCRNKSPVAGFLAIPRASFLNRCQLRNAGRGIVKLRPVGQPICFPENTMQEQTDLIFISERGEKFQIKAPGADKLHACLIGLQDISIPSRLSIVGERRENQTSHRCWCLPAKSRIADSRRATPATWILIFPYRNKARLCAAH